jgi:hypothetical protein
VLIEDRRRLSLALRCRDRCLTVALWGAWWSPFDAIRRLVATEAFRWNEFAADLAKVSSVAAMAVGLLLAWGVYDRWREASARTGGAGAWRRREASLALGTREPALDHAETGR